MTHSMPHITQYSRGYLENINRDVSDPKAASEYLSRLSENRFWMDLDLTEVELAREQEKTTTEFPATSQALS
jgi:hypothetical protein